MQLNKTVQKIFNDVLQPTVGYGATLYALLLFYVFRIRRLVPGFAGVELYAIDTSKAVGRILNNPLNAPHKTLQYIMAKFAPNGFFAMRSVSVAIALACVVLFFYVVKHWFNFRVAVVATFLFATSSWMLHFARLATPDVTYISIIAAVAYGTWIAYNQRRPRLTLALGLALLVWLAYIPGMIWFIIFGAIWQRKTIARVISSNNSLTIVYSICLFALVAPLIYALARYNNLLPEYLGLKSISPVDLIDSAKNFALLPVRLFAYGPKDPVYNLGNMPLLDFFSSVMAIIGIYSFYRNDKQLDRTKMVLGGLLLGWILSSLPSDVGSQIIMPFMYLLVAGGIAFMLEQWFKVFPVNPFARLISATLILTAIFSVSFYQINNYFIAWPQAKDTKSAFSESIKK